MAMLNNQRVFLIDSPMNGCNLKKSPTRQCSEKARLMSLFEAHFRSFEDFVESSTSDLNMETLP